MPLREGGWRQMELLPIEERRKESHLPFQAHWYAFLLPRVTGRTVLDVGASPGYGLDILRQGLPEGAKPRDVVGIDPLPLREDIQAASITDFAPGAYGIVCAIDVVEHVENDLGFLKDLCRAANSAVFFSTPNWDVSRAQNPFHHHEYTPAELLWTLESLRHEKYITGYGAYTSDDHCVIRACPDLRLAKDPNFGVWMWV